MPPRGLIPSIYTFTVHREHSSRYASGASILELPVSAPAAAELHAATVPGPSSLLANRRALCVEFELVHKIQRLL